MVDICIFFPWAFFSAPFCVVWHSSREVMGEACHIHESGYCNMSVCAPLPAQRTDRSAKDWTLSNSSERHAQAHCDHTPPTQHRGRMQPPPPTPTHTHKYIYTHTFGHATFNMNMSFHIRQPQTSCRLHNHHSEDLQSKSVLLGSSSKTNKPTTTTTKKAISAVT